MVIIAIYQDLPEKPDFAARIPDPVHLQGFFYSPPPDFSSHHAKSRFLSLVSLPRRNHESPWGSTATERGAFLYSRSLRPYRSGTFRNSTEGTLSRPVGPLNSESQRSPHKGGFPNSTREKSSYINPFLRSLVLWRKRKRKESTKSLSESFLLRSFPPLKADPTFPTFPIKSPVFETHTSNSAPSPAVINRLSRPP